MERNYKQAKKSYGCRIILTEETKRHIDVNISDQERKLLLINVYFEQTALIKWRLNYYQ